MVIQGRGFTPDKSDDTVNRGTVNRMMTELVLKQFSSRFETIQELCEARERDLEVAHTMHKYYFDVNAATRFAHVELDIHLVI